MLNATIDEQHLAVKHNDYDRFRTLDYEFHKALCVVAKVDYAFDVIAQEKAKVDRLCVLSLSKNARLDELLEDHTKIVACIIAGDEEGAVNAGMQHLSRLDITINAIRNDNADYFDD